LQLYPPKNALLDSAAGGGVCEKDEAWNMHRPKGGRFAGFRPIGRLRKKGQRGMHKRISPSPWEETGFQGPLPDTRDRDIIALSGNGVPSTKACRERRKEGYYTLRKREKYLRPATRQMVEVTSGCVSIAVCTLLCRSSRLTWPDDRPLVLNLAPCHETAVRPLGVGRYYPLE
jgi:hypothetical protein